ncbi:hypothetical protein [Candidatus Tisiphia endosymbiont of Oplodontha viridula]|uniref:hypothetical protein n=1 Tax=Candidatus Tisiphia endosymbiont of Oplodontha viridula TaxID=3077925 RepID=UPI0035C89D90
MKNHKKAKIFCETVIYKEAGAKEKLQNTVKKEIENANELNTSLKQLMEKFGEDFGVKAPKVAIGILETIYESLGTRSIQNYIDDSENLGFEWKGTNRQNLFDEAFNSMYRTAIQKNNENLLAYLNTYKEYITNHDMAKELYEQTDPNKEYWFMVVDKIHKAPNHYSLKGLMTEIGKSFAHSVPEKAVSILEAIYEALDTEKDFIEQNQLNSKEKNKSLDEEDKLSIDALFSEAFYNMYEMAERRNNEDLLQGLEEHYPPVQHIGDAGDIS